MPDANLELVLNVRREILRTADDAKLNIVLVDGAELEADVSLQQHHQGIHFRARPLPVLDGERIEREDVDAEPG